MHEDGKYPYHLHLEPSWKSGSGRMIDHPLPTLESHAAKAKSFFLVFFGGKKVLHVPRMWKCQVSNEKRAPGWLGYVEDYTTQLYRDYNKPW